MVVAIATRSPCYGCGCRGEWLTQGTSIRIKERTEKRGITVVRF